MNGSDRQKDAAYAEQRVMRHVALALEALPDNEARARVLDWACNRFKIHPQAAPAARQDDLSFGSPEELAVYAEQNARRFGSKPALERPPADRAPDPKDNDAVHAWLNALRI